MEIFVDDDTKLTLHGLQQYYIHLNETEKNKKLNDLLDILDFNQVRADAVVRLHYSPRKHRHDDDDGS